MRSLVRGIGWLIARAQFERSMREELAAHLEHRADDLVATGMSRQEAMDQARLEFGAIDRYQEQCREAGGFSSPQPLHGCRDDLKLAIRRLAAAPLFTAFAVLSLSLAVGVTTAAYSVVHAALWLDDPTHDPDGLVLLVSAEQRSEPRWMISRPDFDALSARQQSFTAVTASLAGRAAVEAPASTEIQPAEGVDGRYFDLFGLEPHLGRFLRDEDAAPGAAPALVLSHALWRSRFGADAAVIGQPVRLAGRPFEVVGVAPKGFEGPMFGPRGSRLWIPLAHAEALWLRSGSSAPPSRTIPQLTMMARLRPGILPADASAEVRDIGAALDESHPRTSAMSSRRAAREWSVRTVSDVNARRALLRNVGAVTFGLVVLVLVVACTNLANLVLARGTARHKDVALQTALGASRWRLVREQLAESAVLGAAGGLFSWPVLMVLRAVLDFEVPIATNVLVLVRPEISASALIVGALALLVCLLVFGLEPAMKLTRLPAVREDLVAARRIIAIPQVRREQKLVRWQVTVSALFFVIAALCIKYLAAEARHDSGVDLERIALAGVDFDGQRWDEGRARHAVDRVLEAARRQPGVHAAAVASGLPFGTTMTPDAYLSRAETPHAPQPESAIAVFVSREFFHATGIAVVRGRAFADDDGRVSEPVAIVSETAARSLFGTVEVVGRPLLVQMDRPESDGEAPPTLATIAGVAEDTDTTELFARRRATIYLPFAQQYSPRLMFVVRSDRPAAAERALRAAARRAAPDLAIDPPRSGYVVLAGPHVMVRTLGSIATTLGSMTLLLAMVGLLGVQLHVVIQRTREIGVRMSLGASASQIRTMVLTEGCKPVLQGVAIGLFAGMCGRVLAASRMLAQIGPADAWMLVLVPAPLLLAAFVACWIPASRASRVDPNLALRHL